MIIPFSNIKRVNLQILKNLAQFFGCPFFQVLKKYTYKSWRNFLLIPFSNIKKVYLQILKELAQFFCLPPFSNNKKSILTNLKKPGPIYFAYHPFQILQISKTPFFILITIHIKTIIQIDKHKAKYIITAWIPKITIKFFLLFFKKKFIKMSSQQNY